jgi:endo-alpha-N-acetylgalactosaminidase
MKRSVLLCLTTAFLLSTAHRLPAPISEETRTPAPEQSAKPKPKRQTSSPQPKSEATLNRKPFNIPQSQMTASATSQHGGYEASKAIDGNVNTIWHTPFNELWFGVPLVSLPQSIMLNLGGTYNVTALHYLPRQDGYLNDAISSYRVYVSTDGSNFTLIKAGNWASDQTEKTATFAPTKASYIRLEAVAAYAGYASAAELNVTAIR